MRKKGKNRKDRQILIRVNNEEKMLAEKLSQKEGMNTSEFFRALLHEHKEQKKLDIHLAIVAKYEQMLEKYRKLLSEYKK
jgi:antitoxin component of RelBE/YafQ-DinJ toxin-antitoxin module